MPDLNMDNTLILHGLAPMNWALAGGILGLVTLLLLWLTNTRLGVSSTYEDFCAIASRRPYFTRPAIKGSGGWRLWFAAGLVLGGVLSAALAGGWAPITDLGMWDTVIAGGPVLKTLWLFGGGLLIGFGTRLANGCTSGHGIFGLSNFEPASIVAVAMFMGAGFVTTNLVYRLIFQ